MGEGPDEGGAVAGSPVPAEAPPSGSPGTAPAPAAATTGDRILLGLLVAYAAILLVAAWAQVTSDRALLDIVDFRKFFTR